VKNRTILLAGIATVLLASPVAAQTNGWYLGLGGGWTGIDSVKFAAPPTGQTVGNITFSDSGAVYVASGYRFELPFRVEGEVQYTDFGSSLLRIGNGSSEAGGGMRLTSFLINGLYDWPLSRRFSFSLGAGVGGAIVDSSIRDVFDEHLSGSSTAFTWQAIAGVNMALSEQFEIGVDYRYQFIDTSRQFLNAAFYTGPASLKNKHVQSAMFSVRWFLQGPPPEPAEYVAPPLPPPPPPPPPPPAVKTFIVFFDFDRSDLTADARRVVSEAVSTARATGMVRIVVTGHTDTSGSAGYNLALSQRRASAVKAQLVTDGLSEQNITTIGKGFTEPLIATGPGVREPQNRRAVIDLGA
jgi:outer membrane protein OmpA-like peptidoglycan-associated protein